jgi:hypothetical protein
MTRFHRKKPVYSTWGLEILQVLKYYISLLPFTILLTVVTSRKLKNSKKKTNR